MISKTWQGTDALKLKTFPPGKFIWKFRILFERLMWKIFEPLIDQHFVVHPNLSKYLTDFGIPAEKISVKADLPDCFYCVTPCEKKPHEGLNIAYYWPGGRGNGKFRRWVYGKDIIDQVKTYFPIRSIMGEIKINWIELNGCQDVCEIYPTLDAYIRPNRHDGMPRMILECEALKIPYYWDPNFKPTAEAVYDFINRLDSLYR